MGKKSKSPKCGPIQQVLDIAWGFPSDRRIIWVREALTRCGFATEESLALEGTECKETCFEHWTEQILGDASRRKQMSRLQTELAYFQSCHTEASWINFGLNRPFVRDDWRDVLLDALSSEPIVRLVSEQEKLTSWVSSIPDAKVPPLLRSVVPPLELDELRLLRRAIDRDVKSKLRHPTKSFISTTAEAIEAEGPTTDMRLDIESICIRMSTEERAAIYLRYLEGYSLRDIAEVLKVGSIPSAHRVVRSALEKLHRQLRDKE